MHQKKPLISVVLPVYNVGLYIEESIYSILNQTETDFELIIIDDCSTDNTLSVIKTIKDARIKIVKKNENKGLIDSLNLGFELAKGKYIARMDGDDISVKYRFEKQLAILEQNPDIILCGSWIKHFGKSQVTLRYKETHDDILCQMLLHCPLSFCASMLRKSSLVGCRFDISKIHVEDYDYLSRIVWKGKLYTIQEVLYHYRVHDKQVSSIYNQIQLQGDIPIKLSLFKKLNYDMQYYSDDFLTTMLLLNKPIRVDDLVKFIRWLKSLPALNDRANVFPNKPLKQVLKQLERRTLFSIYFKETTIGIDKNWRIAALWRLPLDAVFYVLNIKKRELIKRFLKG